ncbi:MAG: glycosyltransferase family 2 protein [Candidatus Omnitrophica bacterium]|nr:glycosyltransferase family 2 protein [Candidatus Omnitrophota bacterium]
MRVCVLIPSYNEEKTIGDIVRKIKEAGFEVIVIDDGSTDNTEKVATENGALAMRHIKNLGKGASLKEGFDFIMRMTSFDVIIVMDGDAQHDPRDIQKFISHAEKYGDDIVVGNRMASTKNMPIMRLATNKFMSFLLSTLCKQRIPDTQCGFRLIRRRVLKQVKLELDKYDLESEMLIKASQKKFKVASIPIRTIYRDELSRIRPVKDALRFVSLLVKSYFK